MPEGLIDEPMRGQLCKEPASEYCKKAPAVIWVVKLIIAIVYDALDFLMVLFPIPGLNLIYDMIGVGLGYVLFGPIGLANAWELLMVEPFGAIDEAVPTMTIIAIIQAVRERVWEK